MLWRLLPRRPQEEASAKLSSQDKAQQRQSPSRSTMIQFLRGGGVVAEVFKVFSQLRIQQRLVEQNTLTFQFRVIGGGGGSGCGGLQGLHPRQNSQRTVEQPVDFPLPGGGPDDFSDSELSSSSSLDGTNEDFHVVFRTFSRPGKSAESGRQLTAGVVAHSSSWTPAAHEVPHPRGGAAPGFRLPGPYGCVPMVMGAPSHTHGLSFTRMPQPMSMSSLRTFLSEALAAASGPAGGRRLGGSGGSGRGATSAVLHQGRRSRDQQRQVPAVRGLDRPCLRFSLSSEWWTFLLCSCMESNFHWCSSVHRCNDKGFVVTVLITVEARSCSSSTMWPCSVLAAWRRGRRFAFWPGVGAHHTGDELM